MKLIRLLAVRGFDELGLRLRTCWICRKLLDRVRNIQKNAIGDGVNQCILCGDCSSIWSGTSHVTCKDCQKVITPSVPPTRLIRHPLG